MTLAHIQGRSVDRLTDQCLSPAAAVAAAAAAAAAAPPAAFAPLSSQVSLCSSLEPGKVRAGKVNELFVYDNFSRVPVEEVQAGDICALTGIADIGVSGVSGYWGLIGAGCKCCRAPPTLPHGVMNRRGGVVACGM